MPFDFDTIYDRRDGHSLKWNVPDGELPMWVADMDFRTAPAITEALVCRAQAGIYGYSIIPPAWQAAYQEWWGNRHGLAVEPEQLIFCTGVVPAITCAVKRLTNVGDRVLVQTPVYPIFFHSIENHGRHVVENPLLYDGQSYQIDFEDLEAKLADPLTTLMILCNPHNPVGRIAGREELARIGELCHRYGVTVISDEIHGDLTDPGYEYVPFAAASDICREISVTCWSVSKTFNIAGLQSAAVMISNPQLRHTMERGLNADELAEPNVFAVEATVAAFTQGAEWLDELRAYLAENRRVTAAFLEENLPQLHMIPAHATYLYWLDCQAVTPHASALGRFIRRETGLYLSDGRPYRGNGAGFLRLNAACPRQVLLDGLDRLARGVAAYQQRSIDG